MISLMGLGSSSFLLHKLSDNSMTRTFQSKKMIIVKMIIQVARENFVLNAAIAVALR
jgi:hypothetical protein